MDQHVKDWLLELTEVVEAKISAMDKRIEFLKDTINVLVKEGIASNIEKIELSDGDTVMFTVPDELVYDPDFFNQILPIFQEKNATVIVLHQGIKTEVLRNHNGDKEL